MKIHEENHLIVNLYHQGVLNKSRKLQQCKFYNIRVVL